MKIAVIGAGVAGLGAAWLLSKRHEVVVYEKNPRLGGHSNTVIAHAYGREIPVDTGFIVYNENNYPNLTALFEQLGVRSEASNMSFAVSLFGGDFEFGSGNLSIIGQRSNLFDRRFLRMLSDLLRFNWRGRRLVDDQALANLTLGDWLERQHFETYFVERFMLPLCACIWSCSLGEMRRFPLLRFAEFFADHRLFSIWGQQAWRTVKGGSRQYVEKLAWPIVRTARLGNTALAVQRHIDHVMLRDGSGQWDRFDHIVLGCHADEALAILGGDASEAEREALSAFRYAPNRTILHTDRALMPKRRSVWSSWNYVADRPSKHGPIAVTYWMNRLQNIDRRCPLFVTNNPMSEPAQNGILAEFSYTHPLYDHRAFATQPRLAQLQGKRRTWFCGSYFGFGFHEGALTSGLEVAEALGVARPWKEVIVNTPPKRPVIDGLSDLAGGGPLPGHAPVQSRAEDA